MTRSAHIAHHLVFFFDACALGGGGAFLPGLELFKLRNLARVDQILDLRYDVRSFGRRADVHVEQHLRNHKLSFPMT